MPRYWATWITRAHIETLPIGSWAVGHLYNPPGVPVADLICGLFDCEAAGDIQPALMRALPEAGAAVLVVDKVPDNWTPSPELFPPRERPAQVKARRRKPRTTKAKRMRKRRTKHRGHHPCPKACGRTFASPAAAREHAKRKHR